MGSIASVLQWHCQTCGQINPTESVKCLKCGTKRVSSHDSEFCGENCRESSPDYASRTGKSEGTTPASEGIVIPTENPFNSGWSCVGSAPEASRAWRCACGLRNVSAAWRCAACDAIAHHAPVYRLSDDEDQAAGMTDKESSGKDNTMIRSNTLAVPSYKPTATYSDGRPLNLDLQSLRLSPTQLTDTAHGVTRSLSHGSVINSQQKWWKIDENRGTINRPTSLMVSERYGCTTSPRESFLRSLHTVTRKPKKCNESKSNWELNYVKEYQREQSKGLHLKKWACTKCTLENSGIRTHCEACMAPRVSPFARIPNARGLSVTTLGRNERVNRDGATSLPTSGGVMITVPDWPQTTDISGSFRRSISAQNSPEIRPTYRRSFSEHTNAERPVGKVISSRRSLNDYQKSLETYCSLKNEKKDENAELIDKECSWDTNAEGVIYALPNKGKYKDLNLQLQVNNNGTRYSYVSVQDTSNSQNEALYSNDLDGDYARIDELLGAENCISPVNEASGLRTSHIGAVPREQKVFNVLPSIGKVSQPRESKVPSTQTSEESRMWQCGECWFAYNLWSARCCGVCRASRQPHVTHTLHLSTRQAEPARSDAPRKLTVPIASLDHDLNSDELLFAVVNMDPFDEQVDKNGSLFLAVREKTCVSTKLERVTSCLNDGADVNAADANYGLNTPLHMAVIRAETDIARLLIERGASLRAKNAKENIPLDIARELPEDKRQELLDLLAVGNDGNEPTNVQASSSKNDDTKQSSKNNQPKLDSKKSKKLKHMYPKRSGTSGVSGQLYETKLLSMVHLRAINDPDIEEFYLATNISGIGDFDDVCLRFKLRGYQKPIMVFLQAKHRENKEKDRLTVEDVTSVNGDFSLRKYFDSYLKIISRFPPKKKDPMFDGELSSVELNFIIYTPVKDLFLKKRTVNTVSNKVDELIFTKEEDKNTKKEDVAPERTEPFQFDYNDDDLDYLTKITVEKRLADLGEEFLNLIMAKNKLQVIMASELVSRYHVVIRREVIELVKIQEDSIEYRTWKFRSDFFMAGSEYLDVLRNTFCNTLSTSICDKSDVNHEDRNNFKSMIENPCDYTISKLLGKVVTYDGKKLQLNETNTFKALFEDKMELPKLKAVLETIDVTENIVHEAARIKLESLEFKLPLAFGNLDLNLRGDIKKITTSIDRVVNAFKPLLEKDKNIEINDDIVGQNKLITEGILNMFGSAVGNLIIVDFKSKMLMFDTENTALPEKAKLLLNEFTKHFPIKELCSYRFRVNRNKFPKDSFYADEFDKRQARDFLNRLWFYTDQAKEGTVEKIVKNDIKKHYYTVNKQEKLTFIVQTDAIFVRSHHEIQNWWKESGEAPYITRLDDYFEKAKQDVIDNPLLTILDSMYHLKITSIGIRFNENSIRALDLQTVSQRLVNVVTLANILSGIKIAQHYEKQAECSFIDFDYVLSLPITDYNRMLDELKQTKQSHTLIIVYEKLKYYEGLCDKLMEVIDKFKGSKIVLVSENDLAEEIKSKECYKDQYQSVVDDNTYLTDLDEKSQQKILKEMTIVFQGEELPILQVLQTKGRALVRTEMLKRIIYQHKIEIGCGLIDPAYNEIKDSYIDRTLTRDDTYQMKTLNDEVRDDVVVISGRSGMGKSMLLTHLSLQTKLVHPLPWIVRVNLVDYEKDFLRWQEHNITIDLPLVLQFLCGVALKNFDMKTKLELTQDFDKIIVSEVDSTIDPLALFELELFLYLYNEGNVIFLFDDFNAMCPHYEKEVLKILKLIRDESKRMWIMTCEYRHTIVALQNEFGTPYKLDGLNNTKKKTLLERFFRNNIRLERLNYDQFENVSSFLKFTNGRLVRDPERELVPFISLTFHLIYVLAVKFFQSEINRASPSVFRDRMRENFEIDLDQYSVVDEILGRDVDDEELELAGTPLHLYLAANYFKCRLEDNISILIGEDEARNKWDFVMNTFTMYQHFVEAHMKKIFSREETDDDSIVASFQKTRRDFFDKHKKLGIFALCRENDLTKLLKPDEINEIQETISKIKSGEDRSSLVNCVVDEVPRFAHLVFAEYFAVEYLTDIMKNVAEDSDENVLKCASLWQSILNILLFKAPPGLRNAFEYKLQSDCTLAKLANSDVCREVMFELLLKSGKEPNEAGHSAREHLSPIEEAIKDGLVNLVNLFLTSAQGKLHSGNIDDFLRILRSSGQKYIEFGGEYAETLEKIIESVKDMDMKKFGEIFRSGKLTEVPMKHVRQYVHPDTANEVQRHVDAIQQLVTTSGNLGDVVKFFIQTGIHRALEDLSKKVREEVDSDSD